MPCVYQPSSRSTFVELPKLPTTVLILGPQILLESPYGPEVVPPMYMRSRECEAWMDNWRIDCFNDRDNAVVATLNAMFLALDRFSFGELDSRSSLIVLRDVIGRDDVGAPIVRDVNLFDVLNRDWIASCSLYELYLHGNFDRWIWNGVYQSEGM